MEWLEAGQRAAQAMLDGVERQCVVHPESRVTIKDARKRGVKRTSSTVKGVRVQVEVVLMGDFKDADAEPGVSDTRGG